MNPREKYAASRQVELGKQVDARMSAEADAAGLNKYDVRLIDRALGALTSDYNDVPHDIEGLRKRLAAKVTP